MGWFFLVFVVVFGVVMYWLVRTANKSMPSPSTPTDTDLLSGLPAIYYGLAILCGIIILIFTFANADKFSSIQLGYLIGSTVGGVLSMFAVGRVIQLLQQIRDK